MNERASAAPTRQTGQDLLQTVEQILHCKSIWEKLSSANKALCRESPMEPSWWRLSTKVTELVSLSKFIAAIEFLF